MTSAIPGAKGSGDGEGGAAPVPVEPADGTADSGAIASSTSGDEINVFLTHGRPDPLLGAFQGPAAPAGPTGPRPAKDARGHADLKDPVALTVNPADLARGVPDSELSGASAEALSSLNLGEPSSISRHPEKATSPTRRVEPSTASTDDAEPRGIALSTLLLASYASAVTLGLAWVLWTGRRAPRAPEPEAPPVAEGLADPGLRAESTRRVVVPPAIAAEHMTTIGRPVTIGEIEATPIDVRFGTVVLERHFTAKEKKRAGTNALMLRLKLKNVSSELVLAPLDEAFLRTRPRSDPDSYIDTAKENGPIGLFPLAVESEWSIAGQEFRELRPGEAFETLIVSVPSADKKQTPVMTWRVRLRTGRNHTDDLGVRFRADEIKARPPAAK